MAFDFSTLITDRSPEELQVLRNLLATPMADWTAEQLAEFNRAASKGAYNYTDLNRVIAAMDDINERLTAAGYETGYHPIIVHPPGPPEPVWPLPEGYTELEYIESTGTQWIDFNILPDQNTKAQLKINMEEYTGDVILGHMGSETFQLDKADWRFFNAPETYYLDIMNSRLNGGSFPLNQDLNIEIANNYLKNLDTGENILSGNIVQSFQTTATAKLFFGFDTIAKGKAYYVKFYSGDTLISSCIPSKNQSGINGLYDTIRKIFLSNSGTGNFVAGPEIPQPSPEPILDPYTWYEEDIPTATQMARYLQNVAALRGVLELPEDTAPAPADMDRLTQAEANAIEAVLDIINTYLLALQSIFRRCGAVVCGGPELYFVN